MLDSYSICDSQAPPEVANDKQEKNGSERSYYDEDNFNAISNKKMVVREVNMMKIMMMLLVIKKW